MRITPGRILPIIALVLAIISLTPAVNAVTAIYYTPGEYSFTIPNGVTSLNITIIGGGGGGGGGNEGASMANLWHGGSGGGGGSGYVTNVTNLPVTPGQLFGVSVRGVASGGEERGWPPGQRASNGSDGEMSVFYSLNGASVTYYALGGIGGEGGHDSPESGDDGLGGVGGVGYNQGGTGGNYDDVINGGGAGGIGFLGLGNGGNGGANRDNGAPNYAFPGADGSAGAIFITSDYSGPLEIPLIAGFSSNVTGGDVPLTVQFNDTSLHVPTAWTWDFGDGSPVSHEQNATHTYTRAGDFTVSLTVTSPLGTDTSVVTAYIAAVWHVPETYFTASVTSGNVPLAVHFTDTSSYMPTAWEWDFGDGTPHSFVQNPTHTYYLAGDFTVSLTATNGAGSNTSVKTGYIATAASTPVTSFTASATTGDIPLTVQFTDTSTNTPATWEWDFGDGSPHSFAQNPAHTFEATGFYTVSLIASNIAGSATSKMNITPGGYTAPGTYTFTVPQGVYSINATIVGGGGGGGGGECGSIIWEMWTWGIFGPGGGGGGSGYVTNQTIAVSPGQSYTVIVGAGGVGGFNSFYTQPYYYSRGENGSNGGVSSFGIYSAAGGIGGEGGHGTSDNPYHSDDGLGGAGGAGYNNGAPGQNEIPGEVPVISAGGAGGSGYLGFGNGGVGGNSFDGLGGYGDVRSGVSGSPGAVLLSYKIVTIPVAGFAANQTSGLAPLAVQFTDSSTGYASGWQWDFGDAAFGTNNSTEANPVHCYQSPGTYTVTLTASNSNGSSTLARSGMITVSSSSSSGGNQGQTSGGANVYQLSTLGGSTPGNVTNVTPAPTATHNVSPTPKPSLTPTPTTGPEPSATPTNGNSMYVYLVVAGLGVIVIALGGAYFLFKK